MTPRGYKSMREELMRLKSMRSQLANDIEVARGHGDLSENADYDAAKEKSGMVEAKIRDLDAKISQSEVIDPRKLSDYSKVKFGLSVLIEDADSGEERRLSIVGADESNIDKGWISLESPLGKALIGKEVGDLARVKLPGGVKEYEIQEIYLDYEDDSHPETP